MDCRLGGFVNANSVNHALVQYEEKARTVRTHIYKHKPLTGPAGRRLCKVPIHS